MNFKINKIEKVFHFEDGRLYSYKVYIGLPGMAADLPVLCTILGLLNFRELQFRVLEEHNRVLTMKQAEDPYQWELYLDEVMQDLVIISTPSKANNAQVL